MPVAEFAGSRGWGYDGVLLYAPHPAYGTPEDLKALVDAAHGRGLMVMLDVVYNHFGPEGNYLPLYAPDFFTRAPHALGRRRSPTSAPPVRALLHRQRALLARASSASTACGSTPSTTSATDCRGEILEEIAERCAPPSPTGHVHLATEDNRNITRLHERGAGRQRRASTPPSGTTTSTTSPTSSPPARPRATTSTSPRAAGRKLARALAEGFAYQGEPSTYAAASRAACRAAHLPPTAFIDFLQNHDQVGNRAFGERLTGAGAGRRWLAR